jgi:2-dehydropantoate 2-reductase
MGTTLSPVREERLRALVFGAGVLGSFYAARLAEAGHDVTVVARGRRHRDLVEHGIVLEIFDTHERRAVPVRAVDRMPREERFDVCLVLVRKTQLAEALPVLATGAGVRAFLFMVNTAEGPQAMIDAVGRERVLLGFANAGGERDGHLVRVMEAKRKGVTLGELDGARSDRLERVAAAFRDAGFRVEFSADMDAWLRYHVALVGPFANALYVAGADNVALANDPATLRLTLRAVREAIGVVRAHGIDVEPRALRVLAWLPEAVLVPLLRRKIASPIMDIGGVRHAVAARDEMTALNEELFALARAAGIDTPAMTELQRRAGEQPEPLGAGQV